MDPKVDKKEVYRFSLMERIAHGTHGIAFVVLLFTGLAMILTSFQPAMKILGGINVTRDIHHIGGAVAVAIVVVGFVLEPKFRGWITYSLKFNKNDFEHIKGFPVELLGGHSPYPPQGRFNGGEKMNILLMFVSCVVIAITGFIIWFPAVFPQWLVQWSYPAHSGFALLLAAVFLMHFYLGVLHPDSNRALKGVITGWVSAKFAREHYQQWYDEVAEKEPERIREVK
ncbi:MAG: cytochrome b/b6 domain-containing protein [Thermacetogeniaceae bacterium]|jgi:formate dehydrogenase subunit gamma|nr:formate dehydrogenase [Syntrophomonadaceae bacterium]